MFNKILCEMKNIGIVILLFFLVIVGCSSKKTAPEYLSDGEKFSSEENISEAVSSYESLINEYPDNVLAPEATIRLAAIYQNKLMKNMSEKESLNRAVELFKSIYEKYPDSEQAPTGLFMAGFVQANELHDYDSATETYNFFLQTFPDHELSTSAKEELNNMGLTPEEILQKNLARQE
jgi:TolA-binding protein